jgi:hypothetical protein
MIIDRRNRVLGKKLLPVHFSATYPIWPDLGSNRGCRGGKPATNRLSCDNSQQYSLLNTRIGTVSAITSRPALGLIQPSVQWTSAILLFGVKLPDMRSWPFAFMKCEVRVIAQAASRRLLSERSRVQFQGSPYGICDGQSGNRVGFCSNISVFPVSIFIPPLLHTHLSTEVCALGLFDRCR